MLYISPTNEYPRFYGDIMNANKGWQLGDALPIGWREVALSKMPSVGVDEIAYEELPIEVGGVLTQNWQIRPMTAEEIAYRDAPIVARQKMVDAGLTQFEIETLINEARR